MPVAAKFGAVSFSHWSEAKEHTPSARMSIQLSNASVQMFGSRLGAKVLTFTSRNKLSKQPISLTDLGGSIAVSPTCTLSSSSAPGALADHLDGRIGAPARRHALGQPVGAGGEHAGAGDRERRKQNHSGGETPHGSGAGGRNRPMSVFCGLTGRVEARAAELWTLPGAVLELTGVSGHGQAASADTTCDQGSERRHRPVATAKVRFVRFAAVLCPIRSRMSDLHRPCLPPPERNTPGASCHTGSRAPA